MSKRKAFALRVDEKILQAMQRYADDELRSLNGQIEYVLRQVLRDEGRLVPKEDPDTDNKDSTKE